MIKNKNSTYQSMISDENMANIFFYIRYPLLLSKIKDTISLKDIIVYIGTVPNENDRTEILFLYHTCSTSFKDTAPINKCHMALCLYDTPKGDKYG